jgi:GMP synthase-like glutamine amidotransferase
MRVLVIENYPNATLGLVGEALDEARAERRLVRTHAGEALPRSPDGYDALVMLGGAQSALDDAEHPYLPHEATLARSFGDQGKAVLGICLGSQILARAYGGKNILGRPIEFGWHMVRPTEAGRSDPVISAIGESAPVFHWHVDTFTLPQGAVHLASSGHTPLQAFRIGRAGYGIQFHFEAGTEMVESWNVDYRDEILPIDPQWYDRYPAEAARHGAKADAAGRALARAWVGLIRAPSQTAAGSATQKPRENIPEPTA